ncbi:MFS transporter [Streptomyces sp. NPDC005706]|uniref:MFS transporter n=1 Tax=Streptomyces sp. NPDC005706 TaxID=3157169 RepID=UPI0033C9E8FF
MTTDESLAEPAAKAPPRSPLRDRDFRWLMVGNTASNFGGQIGDVAIPLVAVLTVGASSFDVGVMRTVGQLPYPLFVLFVGVVVDRWRRRNMLIAADLGRAAALALIPLAYSMHQLGLSALYITAFLIGTCMVLFDVGSQAYLPRVVERDQIPAGNSHLETARSAALIAGPALGGLFVAWFSPANALIACVVFYLISASGIWLIRRPEPKPTPSTEPVQPLKQIGEGFKLVFGNAILRSVVLIAAMFNFCYAGYLAIYLVYMPVELKLSSYEIGLALAASGPGLLVGALFSSRLPKRFGYGLVLNASAIVSCVFLLGVSLLHGNGWLTVGTLILLNFVYSALSMTFGVTLAGIRQSITPDRMLGRVMATHRFLGVGSVPLGSFVGGVLGEELGLRKGLFVITIGMIAASTLFLFSALRKIGRELPEALDA